jgi:hypothetical protein
LAAGRKKQPLQPPESAARHAHRADAILAERERQLSEIRLLQRVRGKSEGLPRKAYTLLTRGWSKASWQTRTELVRAAGWLLHLERLRDLFPEL